MAPWHAPSSHLAKSAVSGHAQYSTSDRGNGGGHLELVPGPRIAVLRTAINPGHSGRNAGDPEATRVLNNRLHYCIGVRFAGENLLKFGGGINMVVVIVCHPQACHVCDFPPWL